MLFAGPIIMDPSLGYLNPFGWSLPKGQIE
jgi:hypothetical protein